MWPQIAWLVVTLALRYLLQPKPDKPKPPALTELQVPTVDPSSTMRVVFGTRRIKGAYVHWYGHLDTDAVRSNEL